MVDIEAIIRKSKKTQIQLADAIGVSQSAISKVKKGQMQMPEEWKPLIKEYTGLDPDDFLVTNEPHQHYGKVISIIEKDPNGKDIPAFHGHAFATISPAMGDVVTLRPDTFVRIPMFSQGQFAVQV